jgi:hypothetical protein
MALDRYAKLELLVRTAFRSFWTEKLSSAKQKALLVPGFDVPRGGNVDLLVGPKSGTVVCMMQRSDYVAAYKHTVGQMVGLLVHFHAMTDRELRDGLRAVQARPDFADVKPVTLDPLKISKRLLADLKEGDLTLALVTELPEVPQQARELEANFGPIAELLQAWLPSTVKKKKLCQTVEFYAVDPNTEPPRVATLWELMAPMLKVPA